MTCHGSVMGGRGCALDHLGKKKQNRISVFSWFPATQRVPSLASEQTTMEKKRKRDDNAQSQGGRNDAHLPRITYHAVHKSFDRLFKGAFTYLFPIVLEY